MKTNSVQVSAEYPRHAVCGDAYLGEVKAPSMCQRFDTFQSDKLPFLCPSLIRWSDFCLLTPCWECPISALLSLKHCTKKLLEYQQFKRSKPNWLIASAMMSFTSSVVLFHQLPAVSILWCRLPCGQYAWNLRAPQQSWHVKILSYVDAFAVDPRFCSALPPPSVKGLSFKYTESPGLILLS